MSDFAERMRAQREADEAVPGAHGVSQNGVGENSARVVLPAPTTPLAVARRLLADRYTHPSGPLVLRHWQEGWWQWQTSHYTEIDKRDVQAQAYRFTEHAQYLAGNELKSWAPNRNKIADLLEALAVVCHLPNTIKQPSWIDGHDGPAGLIVACANGLLEVAGRRLLDHDPRYFNHAAVPFNYDSAARDPVRWRGFLEQLWGADADQVAALQEWFGYVISGRLDLQKILLVVGPTRGGKGVIARILGELAGAENVEGPTLQSLPGEFGLAPLIGKKLAVISDARLDGRNLSAVTELLLSISGEDTRTVNRKYRGPWTGKLPVRFMICSNELPRLGDASASIAGRFVTLLLEQSWIGREDPELERGLHEELAGILNWSLDGLAHLDAQGRFTQPESTEAAFIALQDLASPVRAFLRDRCATGPDHEIPVDVLWKAWREWAEDNGHGKGGSKQEFGRDLRATLPRMRRRRPGTQGRQWIYTGVALDATSEPDE